MTDDEVHEIRCSAEATVGVSLIKLIQAGREKEAFDLLRYIFVVCGSSLTPSARKMLVRDLNFITLALGDNVFEDVDDLFDFLEKAEMGKEKDDDE